MPRVRGSEMVTRVSTRGPTALRTSSSDSDPSHHRSPKLTDRRSPKSANSEPLSQKKLGTRIAGLETQLELAQGELKILKNQLASAEAAKKEAQKELEKRTPKPTRPEPEPKPISGSVRNIVVMKPVPFLGQDVLELKPELPVPVQDILESEQVLVSSLVPVQNVIEPKPEVGEEHETDVFEVPVEKLSVESRVEASKRCDETWVKVNDTPESPEKPRYDEAIAAKNEEISDLKLKIEEKEQKLVAFSEENENLKHELSEANVKISTALVKEEKMNLNLTRVEEEFEKSKNDGIRLKGRLRDVEAAKEALETEMKKLRVQTEQWRKAADAAAAILSGGVEFNEGRRVSERCGSMDKNYGGVFDGYGGLSGSPGLGDEYDDGFGTGNGKRKGSGIRMFGDLWRKKGQK